MLAAGLWLGAPASALAVCRQALAIGMDVSRSVDRHEYALQVGGLAQAFEDAGVRAAFFASPRSPVMIAVYDWSSEGDQRLVVPWTEVTGPEVLDAVALQVRQIPKPAEAGMTAVGAALRYGAALLMQRSDCAQHTLDLSGDGTNNSGPTPDRVAIASTGAPLTVNGLAIGLPKAAGPISLDPDLETLTAWYGSRVIRGPGAFVEQAITFSDFSSAMRRKLIRELQTPLAVLTGPTTDRSG